MNNKQVGGRTNKTSSDFDLTQLPTETQGYPWSDLDSWQKMALQANGLNAGNVKAWAPWAFCDSTVANIPVATTTTYYLNNTSISQVNTLIPPLNYIYFGNWNLSFLSSAVTANCSIDANFSKQNKTGSQVIDCVLSQAVTPPVAPQINFFLGYRSFRHELALGMRINFRTDATGAFVSILNYSFEGIQILST